MPGTVLRARLLNSRRRLAIVLFAVPAIVVGLVAMHVLTTGGMSDAGASAASETHHAPDMALVQARDADTAMVALTSSPSAPAEDCAGLCAPDHDMLGMMCALALLVTVVLFTVHLSLTDWHPLKRVATALVAKAAALAPPPPPSLHALSISRT